MESILRKGTNVFSVVLQKETINAVWEKMAANSKLLSWLMPITSRSIIPIAATAPIPQL